MAGLHLVTGYKGTPHITSADQGVFNAMSVGTGDYVFTKGRRFEAQIINNNTIKIYDGSLMMNGRYVDLDSGSNLDATIANGTQGLNRHDTIVIRYTMDIKTGIESVSLVVEKGTAMAEPTDPYLEYTEKILNGAVTYDMPMYRVVLEGLSITKIEPLFQVLAPMADIQHGFYKQNMLINGDFQCNQRGEAMYAASGNTGVKYSVDMWRIHQLIVEVNPLGGITVSGNSATAQGYLTQFIQLGRLETKTYTISAMVDGKICSFTVTPGGSAKEKDFGKFKISALTTSTWDDELGDYNNKLKVNICPIGTNTIDIKYVDVFEGTVAYPHVKEDYATALMRCRRYIQGGGCVSAITDSLIAGSISGSTTYRYRFAIPFEEMAKISEAKLQTCSWSYFCGTNAGNISIENGTLSDLDHMNTSKYFFEYRMKDGKYAIKDNVCGIRVTYVVSCEPSPQGD